MAKNFPILLNLDGKLCIVVGGGDVAVRKVKTLVDRCGMVRVISPDAADEIKLMSEQNIIEWEQRFYQQGDLKGAFLCVAATDDPGVNAEVKHEAIVRRALVNVADDPEGSDYQVPSFFEDGPLLVAVSTSGVSPAVARTLRRMIQAWLGDSFGEALRVVEEFRDRVKSEVGDAKSRVRFWEDGVNNGLLDKAREGEIGEIREMLEKALSKFKGESGKDCD